MISLCCRELLCRGGTGAGRKEEIVAGETEGWEEAATITAQFQPKPVLYNAVQYSHFECIWKYYWVFGGPVG